MSLKKDNKSKIIIDVLYEIFEDVRKNIKNIDKLL